MSATECHASKDGVEPNWTIECSDDELYGKPDPEIGIWLPAAADIIRLYGILDEKKTPELEWKCPGRRPPSPLVDGAAANAAAAADNNTLVVALGRDNYSSDKPPTEFDFDDMFAEQTETKVTPRRTPGLAKQLRGSGQKRTASFKNVMFDIRRQMRLEKLEKGVGGGGAAAAAAADTQPPPSKDKKSTSSLPSASAVNKKSDE